MSGRRSKQRGKRGEREAAQILRDNGYDCRRGWQSRYGSDEADLVSDSFPFHCEVKFQERLNIFAAIDQAEGDTKGKPCAVIFRKNGGKWWAAIEMSEFMQILQNQLKKAETVV